MPSGDPTGRVAAAAVGVAVTLGTFRVAGDAPKPLLLTLGLAFAVIALGAFIVRRAPSPVLLLLSWAALSAGFLGAGRSLVAYGTIQARGTEAEPIVFTARHPWLKWGVVAVVGGGRSRFEHVRVEHARWARVNGLDLLGALSFLESDVELSRSEIANVFGKDALYVRGGRVVARDNLFRDAYRDGLDVDGGSGLVEGNRFVDCRDEAIDRSGPYRVEVVNNEIRDARGGRVAAGADLDAIRSRNTFGRPDAGAREG